MEQSSLKELLTEYENKRRRAIHLAEEKKQKLYASNKNLADLEDEFFHTSIMASKAIVLTEGKEKNQILTNLEARLNELKQKKQQILSSLNISNNLDPVFECSICSDTGYIQKEGKTVMCSCLKQRLYDIEYNKSNMGNLEKENFSTFNFNKYSDEVNFEKYHSPISPRDNIKIIQDLCKNFIDNFDDPNQKNLLFTGNTGLGKTFLSNCIANELLHLGKTVLYQTAPVMLDTIINYRFNKPNCNLNIVDNLLSVDLLIIDDLGTETMNSMKFTELFNIINTRLLNQNHKITKTIISTNLSLNNIFSTYEERLRFPFCWKL